MRRIVAGVILAGLAAATPAAAAMIDDGRAAYGKTCARCHGVVTEQQALRGGQARVLPAVMAPLGPNLTGIYGRPAASIDGFRYSNALKRVAPGIVWDAGTLDRWLADSQAMVKGSYMFIKLGQPERALVIDYLKRAAPYRP